MLDPLDVSAQAIDAVRVDAAQISEDEGIGDERSAVEWHAILFEYRYGKFVGRFRRDQDYGVESRHGREC